jgi:hypothetical protein
MKTQLKVQSNEDQFNPLFLETLYENVIPILLKTIKSLAVKVFRKPHRGLSFFIGSTNSHMIRLPQFVPYQHYIRVYLSSFYIKT